MNPWISPLTRENYFDFKEYEGRPVIHSSCLEHIYPGQGGSVARLKLYFEQEKAKDKPHQSLGKLFHKYLENKNEFVVSPEDRPEPGICNVVDLVLKIVVTSGTQPIKGMLAFLAASILLAAKEIGYQSNWKDQTIIDKVTEKGSNYFDFLVSAQGHHMLTSQQKVQFEGMSSSILSSPWAELIFDKKAEHEVPVLFKVTFDGEDIWCKALLDWVLISKDRIHIIDFKTTSKPIRLFMEGNRVEMHLGENGWYEMRKPYPGAFWNYRYYRQLAFYKIAGAEYFLQQNPEWKKPAPQIGTDIMAFESLALFECNLIEPPKTASLIGNVEINDCLTEVSKYYKTLKKY